MHLTRIFYHLKPLIQRKWQIEIRRQVAFRKRKWCGHIWPIDERASEAPNGWAGWPDKKRFAMILTHDVDTEKGQIKCQKLMKLEKNLGFRSSFNFVPEKYNVSSQIHHRLKSNGFEIGIHGLFHDGKLYKSKRIFQQRAERINHYLKKWEAVGFRSPAMHHNLEWVHDLDVEYDASTFDTDPFEPQPDGMRTIFPFWVEGDTGQRGYVELPYTLPQDFTLFIILREKDISIWKQKLDWIARMGGMALLNAHPDYMNFDGIQLSLEEYPAQHYEELLAHVKSKYEGQYWNALPKEIARFWASSYSSHLPPINADAIQENL